MHNIDTKVFCLKGYNNVETIICETCCDFYGGRIHSKDANKIICLYEEI